MTLVELLALRTLLAVLDGGTGELRLLRVDSNNLQPYRVVASQWLRHHVPSNLDALDAGCMSHSSQVPHSSRSSLEKLFYIIECVEVDSIKPALAFVLSQ